MSEGQWFGISGALHWSKLLYGKIRADADNIYKGDNELYGPYNQNPNRAEGKIKLKNTSYAMGCNRHGKCRKNQRSKLGGIRAHSH